MAYIVAVAEAPRVSVTKNVVSHSSFESLQKSVYSVSE